MSKNKILDSKALAITEAVDLLVERGADLTKLLEEGGLLKALTKRGSPNKCVNFSYVVLEE